MTRRKNRSKERTNEKMMEREGREGGKRSEAKLFQCSFTSCFFYMLCIQCVNMLSLEFPLLKVPCHPHVGCTPNYYDSLAS